MLWLAAIAAAVGGLVFWRRKTLKEDAAKAGSMTTDAVAKAKVAGTGAVGKAKERIRPVEESEGEEVEDSTSDEESSTPPDSDDSDEDRTESA